VRRCSDGAFGIDAAAEQHTAGVYTDSDVEAIVPVCGLHQRAERLAEVQQGQTAMHGTLGVVFLCLVGTEGGEDAVAGVLQHLAAVGLDDGGRSRQGVVHHAADRLRIQVLRQRRRAHHVEEKDADLPQLLSRKLGLRRS
jgi:hypothetical protein